MGLSQSALSELLEALRGRTGISRSSISSWCTAPGRPAYRCVAQQLGNDVGHRPMLDETIFETNLLASHLAVGCCYLGAKGYSVGRAGGAKYRRRSEPGPNVRTRSAPVITSRGCALPMQPWRARVRAEWLSDGRSYPAEPATQCRGTGGVESIIDVLSSADVEFARSTYCANMLPPRPAARHRVRTPTISLGTPLCQREVRRVRPAHPAP